MPGPLTPESGANPRAAQVRIATLSATSIGGQRAHDLRIGPQPAYVANERSDLNRVLIRPETGTKLRTICEDRRALRQTVRGMKSNASVGVAGIITFGIEAQALFDRLTPDQQDAAYRDTAEAVASRLHTTLTGLVVHADETAPHAHFQLPAYDMTGQPISMRARRDAMRDLQTITAQVMDRHAPGIERGRSISQRLAAGADFPDTVHKSVTELHQTLPADLAARRAEVDQAKDDALKAQARVDEMQARVDKLTAKEADLTAKEAKNLATYQKRLEDRQEEALKAQNAIDQAEAEVERLNGMAALAKEAAEQAERDRQQAEEQARVVLDQSAAEVEAARLATQQFAQQKIEAAEAEVRVIKERAASEADRLTGIAHKAKEAAEKAEADRRQAEVEAVSVLAKAVTDAEATRLASQRQAEIEASSIREKAAKEAEAAAAAFGALADQIRAGTISLNAQGRIVSPDSTVLRQGGSLLTETAFVVLPILSEAKAAKAAAEKDRTAAAQERKEAAGLFQTVTELFEKLQRFLKRPDVARESKRHADGLALFKEIRQGMSDLKQEMLSPAPKETIKEPDVSSGFDLDEPGR